MTEPITIKDYTEIRTDGEGVFDQLMQATKAHLEQEYKQGRIKGTEYSQVYLGALQAVMDRSLQFLLQQQQTHLQARLLEEQIAGQQKQNALSDEQLAKIKAETSLIEQQEINAKSEDLGIKAQTAQTEQQTSNLQAEALNIPKQGALLDAQETQTQQQTSNLEAEALNIPKQGELIDKQVCKLNAEFDLISEQVLKATQETSLLAQKKVTEKAQTDATGVDPESVIGKQKQLYAAQTKGYGQDARNKAAKLLVETWNVRRTTDSGTVAGYDEEEGGTDNKLGDKDIAAAIDRMTEGL